MFSKNVLEKLMPAMFSSWDERYFSMLNKIW